MIYYELPYDYISCYISKGDKTLHIEMINISGKSSSTYDDFIIYGVSGSAEYVSAHKKINLIQVCVTNEDRKIQKYTNCYVTGILVDEDTTVSVKLPQKIKLGDKKSTVLKKYKNETYTIKNYEDECTCIDFYQMKKNQIKNKYRNYPDIEYNGLLSLTFNKNKLECFSYNQTKERVIDKIQVQVKEQSVKVNSNEDLLEYFNYNNQSTSYWNGFDGRVIYFLDDQMFDSMYCGEPDYNGDTKVKYTLNYKTQTIHLLNSDGSIDKDLKYKIISSERVIIFDNNGNGYEYVTPYALLDLPEDTPYNQTMYVGQNKKLKYNGIVTDSVFRDFKSSNKKVATVTKDGKVKAIKTGTTTISGIISRYGIDYNVSVSVTVKKRKK